jgi:error-prone DNA polymerase
VRRAVLARLAAADAFRSMGLDRRQALWEVLALREEPPLLAGLEQNETPATLPAMRLSQSVVADYQMTGLSLTAHPLALIRRDLNRLQVMPNERLAHARQGQFVRVAGLVLVRQRPSTASGIVFATIEDETAAANLILRPRIYDRFRPVAQRVAWIVEGRVERAGSVVHVQVGRLCDLSDRLQTLRVSSRDFH